MPQPIKEKKLTERTLKGFLWMITGSGIQIFLKIGVLTVLARLISPKEFGLVGMAVVVVEFSKLFTQMGVGPAIVQRKELESRHLSTGFTMSLLMGLMFSGLLMALAPFLAAFFRMEGLTPVLRLISLIFLIDSLTLIGQALMQRNLKFRVIASIEVVSYALGYGTVGITMAYLGWGVWALVTAHLAQAVLQAILLTVVQPFPKRLGFDIPAFKELLHFGGGMTLGKLGNYLATQGDNLIVGRIFGAYALGIYGRAYQFMVMPANLFGTALDRALFPAMAKVQDNKHRIGKAYLTGVSTIALVAIPLSVILVILAPEIVLVVLGPKWTEVVGPFQILACSLLFRMSYKMSDSLARATGAVYRRAWRQIIYAAMVIAGALIGQFWGLNGVAAGVAIALVGNFLLMAHLSINLASLTWLDMLKAHSHGLALGFTTWVVAYLTATFSRTYVESPFLVLIITGVVLVLLLPSTIWRFPNLFIRDDHKALLSKPIFKRFGKQHI